MKKFLLVAIALLFSFTAALGQTTSGLTGAVRDTSGAVVPGAKVTLVDTRNSREVSTTTNDNGIYKFTNLQPGPAYKLTVTNQGFQTYVLENLVIGIASEPTHNVELTPGQVSETVTVTSTTGDATLNTSDASIGNIIGSRQLKELPIQLRGSPAALIGLQPGAVGTNVFAGAIGGNRSGSVAGSRADQGNVTLDGIDVNDQAGNFAFATVANAPIDSVQEFRAITVGAASSSGRSSGGETELTTNSGTNQFHGNMREYWRHESFAANTFFNNSVRTLRPALRRHQWGGSIGGPLPILQFGEGGPGVISGKDKAFFFFDMERRRDRSQGATSRTVPLPNFLAGQIGYVNNTPGCGTASRLNNAPQCISFLSLAQAAALDPLGIGRNAALFDFLNQRYAANPANDLTGGDGRNTGLLRFNAPNTRDEVTYTTRIDFNPTDRQRFFVRVTKANRDSTNALAFLPGDPDAVGFQDRSYGFAVGWTWTLSSNFTNVATAGMTKQANFFVPAPAGSFPYSFAGGPVGAPFPSQSYQDRNVYVPTIRDDITYVTGNHTFQTGFSWKPILQKATITNDFIFPNIGIGGLNTALNASLRPANLNTNATLVAAYDSAFAYLLGRFSSVSTNFNLNTTGAALPPGSGKIRSYKYSEYEGYFQDNWRIKSSLTLNLGLRYYLYPAPYEKDGLQADNTTDWTQLFATRNANAAAGTFGASAEPFLVYNLTGKANNGPPFYATDKNNFAPRLGFAWNPSFQGGVMGALFGDKKTVVRGNFSQVYDRVAGAITFIENQVDYLFASNAAKNFGVAGNANLALATDPRFIAINAAPPAVSNTPPPSTRPITPFVTNGVGVGLRTGTFNYTIDHNFKIPYSNTWSLGFQRELPGNMLLDASYVGRAGRKLFVQSDAAQVIDFKDVGSGQMMIAALNLMQAQVQAGVAVTNQPWFENQMSAALASGSCQATFGGSCTAVVIANFNQLVRIGDTSDLVQAMYANGWLRPNVGMSSQFGANLFISNQGNSDYHGALISLQKRFSRGLEFELNYTFSKSLDNQSSVVNTVSGGIICDVNRPNLCRGPSDFDIRHLFNANFIYELPFGRGKTFGGGANKLADAVIGGWTLSGIFSARSGLPFNGTSGAFPLAFNLNSPPIFSGDQSALRVDIHNVISPTSGATTIQYFADPVAANNAFRYPHHGELGSRNVVRGPGFWGLDMGLAKRINAPWSEKQRFTLRVDAFNVTNTNAFATPNVNKDSSTFGVINASANNPREIQFAIRFDF